MEAIRFWWYWHVVLSAQHWTEKAQMCVAWRLPRWLLYWAVIRAYSNAWEKAGNKTPDELTYNEVANAAKQAR
jgi:hypothetical protein